MRKILNPFFLISCLITLTLPLTFNLSQIDKNGNILGEAPCNKDTIIDFSFSPDTQISNCSSSGCTLTNSDFSTLTFLNVVGDEETYTLKNATAARTSNGVSRPNEAGVFKFGFENQGQWVMVVVPFNTNLSSNISAQTYELDLSRNTDPALSTLSQTTNEIQNSMGISLSAFNFLNGRDYGIFFHVADSSAATTYLLSYFILSNMNIPITNLPALPAAFPSTDVDYQATGDKLCFGSQEVVLILIIQFQTHLRESYPLWTAWIGILLYWIYYLFTDLITISCYDQRFRNNKWTCWSVYSLHHLGHEEYFTKLSRATLMLVSFCWEGLICAVLYSTTPYDQNPVQIFWVGVVAFVTALPFSYVLGYFFLSKIYAKNLHKFEVMRQLHGMFNKKEGAQKLESQLDDIEQSLFGLYYWYYVIAFVFFVSFWVIAVRQMMQVPFNFYYLHRYWLASLGVAFVLEYFVLDPLMTIIFGNYRFYQIRGFWYNYRLGEKFKELEE